MAQCSFDDPNSIEARQHRLDNRCERTHPKRHWTRRRSATLKEARKVAVKDKWAVAAATRRKVLSTVRAYWRGNRDDHPC